MQAVRQHQDGGHRASTYKKIRDCKIDKFTYFRGKLRTHSNIHDGPFLQNSQWLKVVSSFCRKAPSQMIGLALNMLLYHM